MPIAISDIRLLGGHSVLDFVNTVDSRIGRWGPDYLETYWELAEWGHRVAVIDAHERDRLKSMADFDRQSAIDAVGSTKQLREALHDIFRSEATNSPPQTAALTTFETWIESASTQRRFRFGGHDFAWSWSDDISLDTIGHRLTFSAISLLVSRADRRPIRECPGMNCGWLFLDTSRGGRRQWCSGETCGSHARVLRYRRKVR